MRIVIKCRYCKAWIIPDKKKCNCGHIVSDPVYYVEWFDKKLHRKSIGNDYHDALLALKNKEKEIEKGDKEQQPLDLKTLLSMYYNLANTKTLASCEANKYYLNAICDRLDNPVITDILQPVLTDMSQRIESGKKPATVNKDLALLNSVLNTSVRYGYIKTNPISMINPVTCHNIRQIDLKSDQIDRLIDCCDPSIKNQVIIASHALLRRSEIESLKWGWIDLDKWIFRIPSYITKKQYSRTSPIHPKIRECISLMLEKIVEKTGLESKNVFEPIPWTTFSYRFNLAAKKAGLDGLHFHDLRHYSANMMRLLGFTDSQIMAWAGWKSVSMFQRYTFTSDDDCNIKWQ